MELSIEFQQWVVDKLKEDYEKLEQPKDEQDQMTVAGYIQTELDSYGLKLTVNF